MRNIAHQRACIREISLLELHWGCWCFPILLVNIFSHPECLGWSHWPPNLYPSQDRSHSAAWIIWGRLVREQMETTYKSSTVLLPELWARIKSRIWAAFWLWRWHRQEAVQLSSQSQKARAEKIPSLTLRNLHISLLFILLFLYAALASLHKSPVQQRGEYLWYLSFCQAADTMRGRFTTV